MRTKFSGILTLLLAFTVQLTFAQQTISGTVTDDIGLPLPGVNIVIKGTTTGTQSDFDGNYTINANSGQTLVFTYVGFAPQERAVTASTTRIDLQMQAGEELTQVIVIGFSIAREKKALGYAVSEVSSESIEQRSEGDVARVLSGKSSGVIINNTSGISGSATNINIRGYNSISGSNQPLFIVDGVPISNDTNAVGNFLVGNSGSSRSLDIDPNNIESISVLKGYSAATLYGSEGKNGVILITTKTGTSKDAVKKTEITVIQSVFNNEIASLPDYTKKYGNGFDQSFGNFFSNWGPGFNAEGLGGYLDPSSNINPDGTFPHPYDRPGLADAFPQFQGGAVLPWIPVKDHVKDFFRSGLALNTSVSIAGSSDDGKINYSFNYGRLEDEGFTRGNKTNRNNFSMGGRAQLSNKFTVSGTFNFVITDFNTPPVAFSNGSSAQNGLSVFGDLFYTPTNLPLMDLPFQNPLTGQSVYYRADDRIVNPNWTIANSSINQLTNRFFTSSALNYQINDNLNLSYRVGLDTYSENTTQATNRGGGFPASIDLGEYRTFNTTNTIWDHNIMLTGSYSLTDNLGLNFTAGATSKSETFNRFGVTSEDQIVFGVFRHFNFRTQSSTAEATFFRNIVGLYAQADFDYKNYLYLNLSARNDWVSNQIENDKLYPSASLSFLPSVAFPGIRTTNGINYLKVRGSYGTSAGFSTGFPVANTLILIPQFFNDGTGDIISNTTSSVLGNPNLRPELYEEIEVGFESRFLDNRLSLDFSYYDRTTNDLITSRPLDPSTGFTSTQVNVGKLEGYGFEVDLGLNPVRNEGTGFNWDINANYTKYRTTVIDLGDDFEEGASLGISGFTDLGNRAYEGLPFGTIAGTQVARDENGNLIVDATGFYLSETGVNPIGDATPDFIVNVSNNMKWRGFNFNFLISYQHGGDIFSNTIGGLLARGITNDTDDRLNTFILPGVKADGTPNDIQLNASSYYFDNIGFGPTELRIYDGSVIRLNEVSLGYDFPKRFLEKTPFGAVSFTVAGYNLYYDAINTPDGINFDPNVIGVGVGNGRGLDFLNGPSGKRYGFTVKASF